jgi:hypothetical protein
MPPVKENGEMVETINTAIPEEDRGQHEAEARMNSNIGDSALSTPTMRPLLRVMHCREVGA